jgi:hypothetical protein
MASVVFTKEQDELSALLNLTAENSLHDLYPPKPTTWEPIDVQWWSGELAGSMTSADRGLLGNAAQEKQVPDPACIKARWSEIAALPAYRRLSATEPYKRASSIFERKVKRATVGPFADPLARLRFLYTLALVVETSRIAKSRGFTGPKLANRRTLRAALVHVEKLTACLQSGVRLRDHSANAVLQNGLANLRAQIEAQDLLERKPRADGTAAARYFATGLIRGFLTSFDDPLTSVAVELAPLIGYGEGVDPRTIEKLASDLRRQHTQRKRAELAALLHAVGAADKRKEQPKSAPVNQRTK